MEISKIITTFWIICLSSSISFSQDINLNKLLAPHFYYFIETPGCVGCDLMPINNLLSEIDKKMPDVVVNVYVKIPDSSFISQSIFKIIKSKNIIFLVDDSLLNQYKIENFPTLLIFNFNGDEVSRYNKTNIKKFSIQDVLKSFHTQILNEMSILKILYPIENPKTQTLLIKNSILSYIDLLKNEIGIIDLKTGDSLNTITPDSTIIKYSIKNLSDKDIDWLNERLYPIVTYIYTLPTEKNQIIGAAKIIKGVIHDTINKIVDGISKQNIKRSFLTSSINYTIEGNNTFSIDTFQNKQYFINYPHKLKSSKYIAQIRFQGIFQQNNNLFLDSTYILADSRHPYFHEMNTFLSYGLIKKTYHFDSINDKTLGLIEYSDINNSYYYLNPWMNVYFQYFKENDSINKFKPKGILNSIFINANPNEKKTFQTISDSVFYLMEWSLANGHIDILILPSNKNKTTKFFVVQRYDLNGNFISEKYYHYDDLDNIYRVHLICDYDNDKNYFLVHSQKLKWHLITLE